MHGKLYKSMFSVIKLLISVEKNKLSLIVISTDAVRVMPAIIC